MCLNAIKVEEVKKILDNLPETFPCWKVMADTDGETEYWTEGEEKLQRGKTYKAKYHPDRKTPALYAPAFHAFLSRADAVDSIWASARTIIKFYARKKDIKMIGKTASRSRITVAVSRITRK